VVLCLYQLILKIDFGTVVEYQLLVQMMLFEMIFVPY